AFVIARHEKGSLIRAVAMAGEVKDDHILKSTRPQNKVSRLILDCGAGRLALVDQLLAVNQALQGRVIREVTDKQNLIEIGFGNERTRHRSGIRRRESQIREA